MIYLILTCFLATVAELGIMVLINRKEPDLRLRLKIWGIILVAGNMVFAVLSWYKETQSGINACWYFGLFTYLLCLTLYDLKFRELPDWWHLILPLFYAGLWISVGQPVDIYESIIITVVFAAVLGLIFLLRKDAIGIGDIKLLLLCSIYEGSACVGMLIRGMVLAFFFSIILLLFKKATAKSELPFVPFLLLGALFV